MEQSRKFNRDGKERICEAEGDHVIHRPLAQIVVDPENCTLVELSEKDSIEMFEDGRGIM